MQKNIVIKHIYKLDGQARDLVAPGAFLVPPRPVPSPLATLPLSHSTAYDHYMFLFWGPQLVWAKLAN